MRILLGLMQNLPIVQVLYVAIITRLSGQGIRTKKPLRLACQTPGGFVWGWNAFAASLMMALVSTPLSRRISISQRLPSGIGRNSDRRASVAPLERGGPVA